MDFSKKPNKDLLLGIHNLFAEIQKEFFGGREQINKSIAELISKSSGFHRKVNSIRITIFKKFFTDEYLEMQRLYKNIHSDSKLDLGDFNFRESFTSSPDNAGRPEISFDSPIKDCVLKLIDEYKLPANFYYWVFYVIDTGRIPKFIPFFESEIIIRGKYYKRENSGLSSQEKRGIVNFFRLHLFKSKPQIFYEIKRHINSLPRNNFRVKKTLTEYDVDRKSKDELTYEQIAVKKIGPIKITDDAFKLADVHIKIVSKLKKRHSRNNK